MREAPLRARATPIANMRSTALPKASTAIVEPYVCWVKHRTVVVGLSRIHA